MLLGSSHREKRPAWTAKAPSLVLTDKTIMSASFEIDKAAHQAAFRTAHEFPEAGPQLPVLHRWEKCPHCHQPLPASELYCRVIYCQGRVYSIEEAPRSFTDKTGTYALRKSTGTYVRID